MTVRRKIALGALCAVAALPSVVMAPPAQAAGSGFGYFYVNGKGSYTFYGNDRQSGRTVIASTNVPTRDCLLEVRSVQTTITLPNGAKASGSSLLGACGHSIQMNLGTYSIFQAKTTHQVTLINGYRYSFTD